MVNKKSSINVTKYNSKYPQKFLSSNKQTAFFSTNNALTSAESVVDTKDHTQTKAMNVEDSENNVQNLIVDTHMYG